MLKSDAIQYAEQKLKCQKMKNRSTHIKHKKKSGIPSDFKNTKNLFLRAVLADVVQLVHKTCCKRFYNNVVSLRSDRLHLHVSNMLTLNRHSAVKTVIQPF